MLGVWEVRNYFEMVYGRRIRRIGYLCIFVYYLLGEVIKEEVY